MQRLDFTGIAYLVAIAIGGWLLYEAYQEIKGLAGDVAAAPGELYEAAKKKIGEQVDAVKKAIDETVTQAQESVNTVMSAPATPPEAAKLGIGNSAAVPGSAAAFEHPDQVDPGLSLIFGGGA